MKSLDSYLRLNPKILIYAFIYYLASIPPKIVRCDIFHDTKSLHMIDSKLFLLLFDY
jgi:hypothetical protein